VDRGVDVDVDVSVGVSVDGRRDEDADVDVDVDVDIRRWPWTQTRTRTRTWIRARIWGRVLCVFLIGLRKAIYSVFRLCVPDSLAAHMS